MNGLMAEVSHGCSMLIDRTLLLDCWADHCKTLTQTWRILGSGSASAFPGFSWTMACPWLDVPLAVVDGCANDRQTSQKEA